jgi:hypothetical protein
VEKRLSEETDSGGHAPFRTPSSNIERLTEPRPQVSARTPAFSAYRVHRYVRSPTFAASLRSKKRPGLARIEQLLSPYGLNPAREGRRIPMTPEEIKKMQAGIEKLGAQRPALLEKAKAASAALEKSTKILATFDTAVKNCPEK